MATNNQNINRLARISGISGSDRLVPVGARIPIVRIKPNQYTNPSQIKSILNKYETHLRNTSSTRKIKPKILIVGHGHLHPKYNWLPLIKDSLLLDINPGAGPDIIGDFNHNGFMWGFPTNYFDAIYVTYTPPPSPISPGNNRMWNNFHRILKRGGKVHSNYVLYVLRNKNIDRIKARQKVSKYFNKIYRVVSFNQGWIIMVK